MIDTHAHLYDPFFMSNLDFVIHEIQEAGVTEVWLPNCDIETWEPLKNLSDAYPDFCKPMIGLHPTYVKEDYLSQLSFLYDQLKSTKVLAIGEIGLDYFWDLTFINEQKNAFEQQCHWALENQIWIDVHCRKAYADLIKILKKSEFKDLKGIIHCFSGDANEANTLVDLGYSLGIGGVITYKNSQLFKDIQSVPLANLVLETDSPYLTPVPFRGTQNSPKHIPIIAQKLADLFEISYSILTSQIDENVLKFKQYSNF